MASSAAALADLADAAEPIVAEAKIHALNDDSNIEETDAGKTGKSVKRSTEPVEGEEESDSPLTNFITAASLLAFFIPVLVKIRSMIHRPEIDEEPPFFTQVGPYASADVGAAILTGFVFAAVPDIFYNNLLGINPELLILVPYLGCQNCKFRGVLENGGMDTLLLGLHQLVGLRLAVSLTKRQDRRNNWFSKYVALAYLGIGATATAYFARKYKCAQQGADLAILLYISWVAMNAVKTVIKNFTGALAEAREKIRAVTGC